MWIGITFVGIIVVMLAYRWWQEKRTVQASASQLEALILEARVVTQDMEEILNTAVDVSRSVIDDVESKIKEVQTLTPPILNPLEASSDPVAQFYNELLQGPVAIEAGGQDTTPIDEPEAANQKPPVLSKEDYPTYRNMHPYMAVRQLHERGFSVVEISRIMGRGQGEIHLILNLSHRKMG